MATDHDAAVLAAVDAYCAARDLSLATLEALYARPPHTVPLKLRQAAHRQAEAALSAALDGLHRASRARKGADSGG